MSTPLWSPSPERVAATRIEAFRQRVAPQAKNSDELWDWSVESAPEFWRAMWDEGELIGDPGQRLVAEHEEFSRWSFLPDAKLNVAENLLAEREGAATEAILAFGEGGGEASLTWETLRSEVAALASWLRAAGVEPGDRVAAWMPHVPETIIAFLAAASVGAVFTSTSADFGTEGVIDRFGQTKPTVLVAADGYQYGGKSFDCLDRLGEIAARLQSVTHVLVVGQLVERPEIAPVQTAAGGSVELWSEALAAHAGATPDYLRVAANHPLYILYSSGTTGKPKCIVHRSLGVLLKHVSEQRLHCDMSPGDRVFYFTTCGWMMWNWLVSCLGTGATIVLYDGNPAYPNTAAMFDLCDRYDLTFLGVSAKFLDASMKAGLNPSESHQLASLRTICSTGSPLSHEGFAWVYDQVKRDVHMASMSGGTDLVGCLVLGDPTKPVHAGEIQQQALGMRIDVFNDDGAPCAVGEQGELVCVQPFPSMPLEFWDDHDGSRYRSAYFERFPGVWAHGDFASWTEAGGMIIHGRSDATLNASGVRIGTAEIYRVVEQLDAIQEAIAVGQLWDGDTRIVLFVRLCEGETLTDELRAAIRSELRAKCSPRHVPAVIVAVPDIPRTRSGKIVELAVTEVIHQRPVKNLEALANPEALEFFVLPPEQGPVQSA